MSRIAIVGGHGKIARLLQKTLTERGDEVIGIIRNPDHADEVRATGTIPVVLDIESSEAADLKPHFDGVDAVVFAAGAGPNSGVDRKRSVDYGGSVKAAAAAGLAGAKRFVQISAIGMENDPDPERGEVWGAYVLAKREADEALRAGSLDWTILRPGRLTDDAGTGRVQLGESVPYGSIPRADVALLVAEILDAPGTIGLTLDAVSGDEPIDRAVRGAAA